uniref:5'-nucleotidase n=1 Tax=Timema genevievae TaxID=629358 RepID=A0A7R9PMA4_TIMGE|nr:unnamed protein product [Timema genevievae]
MKPGSGDWTVTIDFLQETAIISLSSGSNNNANPYGVIVTDELTAIKDQVTKLKESNQNVFIIVIGSTSEETAEQILSSTGVDLVIPVISGRTLEPPPTNPKETLFERKSSDSVLVTVIKTSKFPFLLGDLSIELDGNNVISDYSAQVIDYSESETTKNSTVLEFGASTLQKYQDLSVSLLAVSDVPLNAINGICNNQECTLGNTVTDSIMWYIKRNQNNAAIAVYPGGGFQNTLISEGTNITGKMVETLFVRDAYLYQISLTGRQVKQLFEVSAQNIEKGNKNEDWLHVSNDMSVLYDTSQPIHRRVVSVQTMVPPASELSRIDLTSDSEKHVVLVPASMLSTDSYSFLKTSGTNISVLSVSVVDVMKLYLQANNYLISAPLGRRITYKYSSSDQPPVQSNTGIVVLVTLIITALVAGGGYLIWKYLLPRYRGRSSSTIHLVELSGSGTTYGL